MSTDRAQDRLRVPIVYHFFAHYRGPVNRELLANGAHEYWFVGSKQDPRNIGIKEWAASDEAPGRFIPTKNRFFGGRILLQSGLIKLALDKRFDSIVFLGDPNYITTWLAAPLARLAGKRVLFWTHGWLRKPTGLNGFLRKTFFRLADGLLLYGHRAKMYAVSEGFDPESVYVVYNSLDYREQVRVRDEVTDVDIEATRKSLFPDSDNPVITLVGRINRGRRADLLIKAAGELKKRGRPIDVTFIGGIPDPGLKEELEEMVREAEVNVNFYGPCYDENLLCKIIMSSTALVSPGKVGLLAMHSLTFGTPCISHNEPEKHGPEFESIIPGENGAVFDYGDLQGLSDAIEECAKKPRLSKEDRKSVWAVIDERWNPMAQQAIIDAAVSGIPASKAPLQDCPSNVRGIEQ